MTGGQASAMTLAGDGQDRKRKRGCQGGESSGTSVNSTPARSDGGSSPSTLAIGAVAASAQPGQGHDQEASSSRPSTIRARGKRQQELSRFFVDTRRNSEVEPPQDPQPSDVHEHDDDMIDEVQDWIEQEMLDDDDEILLCTQR